MQYYTVGHELLIQMRNWSGAYYEFIFGLALYTFWRGNEHFSKPGATLGCWQSAGAALVLVAASCAFLYAFGPTGVLKPPMYEKQLAWGLPALLVFCTWLYLFSRITLTGWAGAAILAVGDSSFMLYLVHVPVVAALRSTAPLQPLWQASGEWFYMTAATLASLVLAWILYLWIELPLLKLIRAGSARRRASGAENPA